MEAGLHPDPLTTGPRRPTTQADLHEAIRRRAEEIYIRNGRIPGRDPENWAQAESEIRRESAKVQARRTAVAITVNGVKYIGEYDLASCGDYTPGEFGAGSNVVIRFDGNKMFVERPNGKELETTIVGTMGT